MSEGNKSQVSILIKGIDAFTPQARHAIKTLEGLGRVTERTSKKASVLDRVFRGVGRSLLSIRGIIGGLVAGYGFKRLSGLFIEAASSAEMLQKRLTGVAGRNDSNALFKDLVKYAGEVPYQFEEILTSAVSVRGAIAKNNDEAVEYIKLIGDVAAFTGLTFDQTRQQMVRAFSAGIGSADLFRERGVTAMLGFKAGVTYTAQQTKDQILAQWTEANSRFKGMAESLSGTWTGIMSMIADKWFRLRNTVLDEENFGAIKGIFEDINKRFGNFLDQNEGKLKEIGKSISDAAADFGKYFTDAIADKIIQIVDYLSSSDFKTAISETTVMLQEMKAASKLITVPAGVVGKSLLGLRKAAQFAGGVVGTASTLPERLKAGRSGRYYNNGNYVPLDEAADQAASIRRIRELQRSNALLEEMYYAELAGNYGRLEQLDTQAAAMAGATPKQLAMMGLYPGPIDNSQYIKTDLGPIAGAFSGIKGGVSSALGALNGSSIENYQKLADIMKEIEKSYDGVSKKQQETFGDEAAGRLGVMTDAAVSFTQTLQGGMVNALVSLTDFSKNGSEVFADFAKTVVEGLIKMAAQLIVNLALALALQAALLNGGAIAQVAATIARVGGFVNSIQALGNVQFGDKGSVTNTQTGNSVFGSGGRSAPVDFAPQRASSGGDTVVNYYIDAIDTKSFEDRVRGAGNVIVGVVGSATKTDTRLRSNIRGVR